MGRGQLNIRRGGPSDLEAIVRCQALCWREAYTGLVDEAYLARAENGSERLDRWRRRLDGERVVVVAMDHSEVVGVASAVPEPSLELASLYVRRNHHGSGPGQELLDAVIGDSPARLWVFEQSPRAIAFYARNRFVPTGEQQVDPDTGIWEIRMARD